MYISGNMYRRVSRHVYIMTLLRLKQRHFVLRNTFITKGIDDFLTKNSNCVVLGSSILLKLVTYTAKLHKSLNILK